MTPTSATGPARAPFARRCPTVFGLVAALLAGCAAAPDARKPAFDPLTVDIAALQAGYDDGAFDVADVVDLHLGRIAALDDAGPRLNAVVATAPDLDAQLARVPDSLLRGVPVLVKDNIDVDAMPTTAGSLALADHIPPDDAFLVARLREAGAVILGKANLSEWANFRSSRSSSGWSAVGGQTKNPHALDRNPCGSSAGSAVAVAAGFAVVAVGTETDGSIVCPAGATGVVGIKPTLGLVSRDGIVPIAHSQDTAGPIARTVRDAATLLQAMVDFDADDVANTGVSSREEPDYLAALDVDALRGARIGVARRHFGFHAGVDAVMERAIDAMRAAGAVIVDPADLPTHGQFGDAEYTVLLYEFKTDLARYLDAGAAPLRTLDALIDFNRAHADTELRWFGQDVFEEAAAKGSLDDPEYLAALEKARRLSGPEGIDAVMDAHDLDALVAPTNGPAWTTDLVNGDHFLGGSSRPAAVAGYPNITVPAGHVHGLPIGISFFGRAFSEPTLIGIAYAFEQATKARRVPDLP